MQATKNMDSVFDQNTQDELDFDVLFDEEDSIIDTVVGVDENGDPITGAEDMPEEYEGDADVADEAAESTEDTELDDAQLISNLMKNGESDASKELDLEDIDNKYQKDGANGKVPSDKNNVTDTIEDILGEASADSFIPEGEDYDATDDYIDPVGAPSSNPNKDNQYVSKDIPSDKGDGKISNDDNFIGNPESQQKVSSTVECGDTECMIKSLQQQGYTVTKDDSDNDTDDVDNDLDPNQGNPSLNDPEIEDDEDDVDNDLDGDTASDEGCCKEEDDISYTVDDEDDIDEELDGDSTNEATDIDDDLDDDLIDAAEEKGSASVNLDYDPSDEDIIDMALGE